MHPPFDTALLTEFKRAVVWSIGLYVVTVPLVGFGFAVWCVWKNLNKERIGLFATILLALVLGIWCASCSDVDEVAGERVEVPIEFLAAFEDLRDCTSSYGVTLDAQPPSLVYLPTVQCNNYLGEPTGAFCCISPTRGGEERNGVVYLPKTCDISGWMAPAYAHEALHARGPDIDKCHEGFLWTLCLPPIAQSTGCTPN